VPETSPTRKQIDARWTGRGQNLRKDMEFQKDLLTAVALATHGNRLAMRERRRRDLRQLGELIEDKQRRWDERLERIQGWKQAIARLQTDDNRLQQLIESSAWLQKARRYQRDFIARLERRGGAIAAAQAEQHPRLIAWAEQLAARANDLRERIENREEPARPLYVTRARKQPEIEFLQDQYMQELTMGEELNGRRHQLQRLIGRLHKAAAAIERRASGQEILYEVHKQELLEGLRELHLKLQVVREVLLEDALIFEAGRHWLRQLRRKATGLRLIEELPQRKPFWRKIFSPN
jgi:hypothetical protein